MAVNLQTPAHRRWGRRIGSVCRVMCEGGWAEKLETISKKEKKRRVLSSSASTKKPDICFLELQAQ